LVSSGLSQEIHDTLVVEGMEQANAEEIQPLGSLSFVVDKGNRLQHASSQLLSPPHHT